MQGTIFNIQRYSIHDGPGIRTAVFFKGCPLSCWWCHNPEGLDTKPQPMIWPQRCMFCGDCVQACPRQAVIVNEDGPTINLRRCRACGRCAEVCPTQAIEMVGRRLTVAELMLEVEKDRVFYDQSGGGVTFTGGEPLAQPQFLQACLRAAKEAGLHTVVDTSGYAAAHHLTELMNDVDLFLYDLKHMDASEHRRLTGVDNALILDNLRMVVDAGRAVRARFPLIPDFNDGDNIHHLGAFLRNIGIRYVHVLPYHGMAVDKYARLGKEARQPDSQAPPEERIQQAITVLQSYGLEVVRGG